MGGRGQNSSISKKYTAKDIKTLRSNVTGVRGYELNGIYLLKLYDLRGSSYSWIISKESDRSPAFYTDYSRGVNNGTIINVGNFKEGKEKIIELANKKRK